MSVNKVILLGNVGKDPTTRVFENGQVSNFSLATSERGYTTSSGVEVPEKTEWHNIVCWNGLSKVVDMYVKKGSQLYIEGKIRTRSYEAADGTTKYVTEVQADNIEFVGKKSDNANNSGAHGGGQIPTTKPTTKATESKIPSITPPDMGSDDNEDLGSDLPF